MLPKDDSAVFWLRAYLRWPYTLVVFSDNLIFWNIEYHRHNSWMDWHSKILPVIVETEWKWSEQCSFSADSWGDGHGLRPKCLYRPGFSTLFIIKTPLPRNKSGERFSVAHTITMAGFWIVMANWRFILFVHKLLNWEKFPIRAKSNMVVYHFRLTEATLIYFFHYWQNHTIF